MKKGFLILTIICIVGANLTSQVNYDIILRAKALIDNGKAGESYALLTTALSGLPDSRLYVLKGDASLIKGNIAGAIGDYQSANKLISSSGDYGLAMAYAYSRDVKNSLFYLDRNISSPFRKSEKEILLENAFTFIENTPEWRLFWKTERYSYPERKLSEVEFNISTGKISDAELLVKELTESYPNDRNTLYARALLLNSQQKYPESLSLVTELLAKDKNSTTYLLLLGTVQMNAGNMPGASSAYTRLIENECPDAGIYLKRAECYRKTQELDKASADVDKFLSYYPGNKEALSLSGRIASERGNNLKAIELYTNNINLHPEDPQCFIDRANSYFISKTWENAIRDYSMALDLKPNDPDVWLNMGISLLNSGKTEDACFDFRRALELGNKKASAYINRNCIK